MKKVILSTLAIATLLSANEEIDALKAQLSAMENKISSLEQNNIQVAKPKGITVKSKAPVIKFSGTHYLGFVHRENGANVKSNKFETRRNYFQAKAYFKENPKSYVRITMDTYDERDRDDNPNRGQTSVREKYAYLYLDNILPNTGVELGQTHRPWIDYEEHNSWNYRSISKVLVEARYGANLTNSADRGIDVKTKTPYFSSELGVFNGEGYHNAEDGRGLSGEWRLTSHLLGTGKQKAKHHLQYANVSFFGQQNKFSHKHGDQDLNWLGFHAVYNQPEFLVAAQYIDVSKGEMISTGGAANRKGNGFSLNGEYRISPKMNLIGRYDYFDLDDSLGDRKRLLSGISFEYNHNIEFIVNYLKDGGSSLTDIQRGDALMLTAQIEW